MRTLDEPLPPATFRERLLLIPLLLTALFASVTELDGVLAVVLAGAFASPLLLAFALPLAPAALGRQGRRRRAWQALLLVVGSALGPGLTGYHLHLTLSPIEGEMPTAAVAFALLLTAGALPCAWLVARKEALHDDRIASYVVALVAVGVLLGVTMHAHS